MMHIMIVFLVIQMNIVDKSENSFEEIKENEEKEIVGRQRCPVCSRGYAVEQLGKFGLFICCSRFPKCKWHKSFKEEFEEGSEGENRQIENSLNLPGDPEDYGNS